MNRTETWTANLFKRGRMKRSLRRAGVRFTEEKVPFGSHFTVTGTNAQLMLAYALFFHGKAAVW